MFPWAFDNAWLLSAGWASRIMLGRLADPILLSNKEALAHVWSAQMMINNLLAGEKGGMTPTADIMTEFLQIWLTTV